MNEENKQPITVQAAEKAEKHRVPLFHITKRDGVTLKEAIGIRAIAIVAALVFCAVVTVVLTGDNPFSVYATLVKGAFGKGRLLVTIHQIAILLCISLAVTPAFRMRFWNTGAEGQTLIGGLATALVMFGLNGKVPTAALVLLMLVAGIGAGVIWGVIPAVFKAQWKTNETLFTLMMRTSGALNSWWGISVPTLVLPSLVTDSLEPSTAPRVSSCFESESEYMLFTIR